MKSNPLHLGLLTQFPELSTVDTRYLGFINKEGKVISQETWIYSVETIPKDQRFLKSGEMLGFLKERSIQILKNNHTAKLRAKHGYIPTFSINVRLYSDFIFVEYYYTKINQAVFLGQ